MNIVFELFLLALIAFCAWRGYKTGLVVAACGIVAVIISLVIASAVADKFSGEFEGMLQPFAGGVVDGAVRNVVYGAEDEEELVVVLTQEEKRDVAAVSRAVMMQIGLEEAAAERVAEETAAEVSGVGQAMSGELTNKLCENISYTAVFAIAFILVFIIFAFIENLLSIYIELPKIKRINDIAGAVAGGIKGLLLVLFFACLMRYAGILISAETIDKTILTEWFANHNFIANILKI